MKRLTNQIIAVLLSLCMVFHVLSVTAYADEIQNEESSLEEGEEAETKKEPEAGPDQSKEDEEVIGTEESSAEAEKQPEEPEPVCGEQLIWNYDRKTGSLTIKGKGAMYDYDRQDHPAPWTNLAAESLIILEGVTSIGKDAFADQASLKNVQLPETLEKVGKGAFYNCAELLKISVPETVTEMEECGLGFILNSRDNDRMIKGFVLTGTEASAAQAYAEANGFTFESGEEGTGEAQSYYADIAESGTCGDNVDFVLDTDGTLTISGKGAMTSAPWMQWGSGNDTIKEVVVQEGIIALCVNAFKNCQQLVRVSLPSTLLTIGDNAFDTCISLPEITIPDSVTTIGYDAFNFCWGLTEITIPDKVQGLYGTFRYCNALETVNIGFGLTGIGSTAFYSCPALKAINVSEDNEKYSSLNGILFNKAQRQLIRFPEKKAYTTYTMPSTVTTIASYAFYGCSSLNKVVMKDNMQVVYEYAFYNCSSLKEIVCSRRLFRIDDRAFQGCNKLTEITFSSRLKTIGQYTFKDDAQLKSITFKGAKPEIADNAFQNVTAAAYYPGAGEENQWPEEALKNYGGTLTWESRGFLKTGIARATFGMEASIFNYTGSEIRPKVTVAYENDVYDENYDYRCTYSDNIEPGTATVTVTGIGDFTGTVTLQFRILGKVQTISAAMSVSQLCAGKRAEILVTGAQGSLSFSSGNTSVASITSDGIITGMSAGDAVITVKAGAANGYEEGFASLRVSVGQGSISDAAVTFAQSQYEYTGEQIIPQLTVRSDAFTLTEGKDYSLKCSNNVSPGTASVIISGMGSFSGSVTRTYTIIRAKQSMTVEISAPELRKGETAQITVSGNQGRLLFTSSDESIASVDAEGKVTAAAEGTAVITVTAQETDYFSEASQDIEIRVNSGGAQDDDIYSYSYSFGNNRAGFGYPADFTIPLSSYEIIFGKNTKAEKIYAERKENGWGGNCAGMSATSALLAAAGSGLSSHTFKSGASLPKDLSAGDVSSSLSMNLTAFIEAMQIAQFTTVFSDERRAHKVITPEIRAGNANLDGLYNAVKSKASSGMPTILALGQSGGHAVLAYKTEEVSAEEARIHIYDSNFPLEDRYITLKKSGGHYNEWFYDMGSHGEWGTDDESSSISYISYETIRSIWNRRGNVGKDEASLAIVNSQNFAVYDVQGNLEAVVSNGNLTDNTGKIILIEDELSLTGQKAKNVMLSLPTMTHTISNLDRTIPRFDVTVVDTDLGLSVETTVQEVTIAVDDEYNTNALFMNASRDDTYNVTLNNSFAAGYDEVVVNGKGQGEPLSISQSGIMLNFSNCDISLLMVDGEQVGVYEIQAGATNGGRIDPAGTTSVRKGDTITYTVTPEEGYSVSSLVVDGVNKGAITSYTFSGVTKDHTIYAVFQKSFTGSIRASLASDSSGAAVTTAPSGAKVLIRASAAGGSGSYTYKFLIYDNGAGTWYKLRDFAAANTYTWTPGATGTKTLFVDIRDGSGTTIREKLSGFVVTQKQTALSGTVKAYPASDTSGSPVTTAPSGTKVLIKADGTGGSGGYAYKFLIYDNGADTWYKLRDFTSTNTYTWTPGATGTKTLFVDIRDSAGTTFRAKLSGFVVTQKQTALSGTVKASLASDTSGKAITTAKSGTRVQIRASAAGGSGNYSYKFLIYDNGAGTWFKLRDFTSTNTYTWTPGATGTKTLFVDIKDSAGKTVRVKLSGFVVTAR